MSGALATTSLATTWTYTYILARWSHSVQGFTRGCSHNRNTFLLFFFFFLLLWLIPSHPRGTPTHELHESYGGPALTLRKWTPVFEWLSKAGPAEEDAVFYGHVLLFVRRGTPSFSLKSNDFNKVAVAGTWR